MSHRPDEKHDDLMYALLHPLRKQILRAMLGKPKISPREIADLIDQPLPNVSYHVRVLADRKTIALVDTAPARGAVQHFYRVTIEEPWALEIIGVDGKDQNGEPTPEDD